MSDDEDMMLLKKVEILDQLASTNTVSSEQAENARIAALVASISKESGDHGDGKESGQIHVSNGNDVNTFITILIHIFTVVVFKFLRVYGTRR